MVNGRQLSAETKERHCLSNAANANFYISATENVQETDLQKTVMDILDSTTYVPAIISSLTTQPPISS